MKKTGGLVQIGQILRKCPKKQNNPMFTLDLIARDIQITKGTSHKGS